MKFGHLVPCDLQGTVELVPPPAPPLLSHF